MEGVYFQPYPKPPSVLFWFLNKILHHVKTAEHISAIFFTVTYRTQSDDTTTDIFCSWNSHYQAQKAENNYID